MKRGKKEKRRDLVINWTKDDTSRQNVSLFLPLFFWWITWLLLPTCYFPREKELLIWLVGYGKKLSIWKAQPLPSSLSFGTSLTWSFMYEISQRQALSFGSSVIMYLILEINFTKSTITMHSSHSPNSSIHNHMIFLFLNFVSFLLFNCF